MLNRIFLHGRIVRDLELKHTSSGVSVVSFPIAVDRDYKDQETGERVSDFIDIVCWRATAEFVCKYFAKGRSILLEGTLQTRNWQAKDGTKRRAVEVIASNVWFGDSRRPEEKEQKQEAPEWQGTYQAPEKKQSFYVDGPESPESLESAELPF